MRHKGKTWFESYDSWRFDMLRVQSAIRERRRCNAPSFAPQLQICHASLVEKNIGGESIARSFLKTPIP
jgi:hypothetical protein